MFATLARWLCNQLPGRLPRRHRLPGQARVQAQDWVTCRLLLGQLHNAVPRRGRLPRAAV